MGIIGEAYLLTGMAILISFVNFKTLKIQPTVAVLISALIISLSLLFGQKIYPSAELLEKLKTIDFSHILLQGILGFLLFAGTLTVDSKKLMQYRREIAVLSLGSTICSMFLIAFILMYLNNIFQIVPNITLSAFLLFGSLISPTDPIAVLNILKQAKAPKSIETILAGESLFNDGIGIVSFLTIYSVIFLGSNASIMGITALFLKQSIGGICCGYIFGVIVTKAIKQVQLIETLPQLLTFVIPTAGYSLCEIIGVSGPLAMVSAGLFINYRCSEKIKLKIHEFWMIMDELLNIILFLLVGFEVILVHWSWSIVKMASLAIFITLIVRVVTVSTPLLFFKIKRTYESRTAAILIWGGLRGGLALALALSLPDSYIHKDIIIAMTYGVVIWSILIQGTSVPILIKTNLKK